MSDLADAQRRARTRRRAAQMRQAKRTPQRAIGSTFCLSASPFDIAFMEAKRALAHSMGAVFCLTDGVYSRQKGRDA